MCVCLVSDCAVMDIVVYEVCEQQPHADVLNDLRRRNAQVHFVDDTIFAICTQEVGRKICTELQSPQAQYKLRYASSQKMQVLLQRLAVQAQASMPGAGGGAAAVGVTTAAGAGAPTGTAVGVTGAAAGNGTGPSSN